MQECYTCGSLRGALGNWRPYRDTRLTGSELRKRNQSRLRFWLGQVGEKIECHPPRLHGGIAHLRDSRH